MKDTGNGAAACALPGWVPGPVRHYLHHTELGLSIREVARERGCHASTILRQIRRFEQRRDDPLVDEALSTLGATHFRGRRARHQHPTEIARMAAAEKPAAPEPLDEDTIAREGRRILRRLAEPGAVLAVAGDLPKAAVVRDLPDGRTTRTAVVDRSVAQAFALQEWIACTGSGRITRYRITSTGRAALKRMLAADADGSDGSGGFAEAQSPFAEQHRDWGSRVIPEEGKPRRVRYNMAESPVVALARRRDKDGTPFLKPELVAAAERLREDFELARMGPRVAQNWERFLTGGTRGGFSTDGPASGPEAARDRVARALRDLGPGLGDMVLRCCCFLEGLEATEKRMGWSARSGKIVLRIALMRLARHYEEEYGAGGGRIG